jgi:DNA-binding transcriptional LysR family regulator
MTPELARQIDVVIACASDDFPGFHRQLFISDTDAVAIRQGHPELVRIAELEGLLDVPHVAVVGYGQTEDMVDTWLRGLGLARRIALVAPSYLQALHMVARTDLVAIVPRRQAESLANAMGIDVLNPPIDPGTFEEYMFHPTRLQVDAGSVWLRSHLRDVGRGLEIPPTDTAMPKSSDK